MTASVSQPLPARWAVAVFLAFAAAYFMSALLRAITATLAPTLSLELDLQASDLGLLAGGYFLGFAATQLPLGKWLDRYGPRKVILVFLTVAVMGCAAFAWATSFMGLLAARVLTGAGVSACLMAPLTGYRRWLQPHMQLRANSWMLMTGSLGMVAATLPVQWLMPWVGWRGLFWLLAVGLVLCMLALAWIVPAWTSGKPETSGNHADRVSQGSSGYGEVWRHPYFRMMALIGFVNYGGMLAMQTLWAGPWLVRVSGQTPLESAAGLFGINLAMLVTFWGWGMIMPRLVGRGIRVESIMAWSLPTTFVMLMLILWLGPDSRWWHWAMFCVLSTGISLAQPAVAMAFPAHMAGRALSAYNLVIFSGIFVMQWSVGLGIDLFTWLGTTDANAFRATMGVFLVLSVISYGRFLQMKAHNPVS
jgi:MFS family permease